uniref:Phenolic glucoside malonyltransferase 1 n=1 Tax=Bemisia tabaci TaxID=7038 RepID=MAT1_BEMTA|nr:RecName: Full=Phenolic glucoside malonyltransferase 1; Short=BtPMaT1 [Bemisia tabaci]QNN26309.1 phenolic glucoside malonyltransferase [Bemisia tabaci]
MSISSSVAVLNVVQVSPPTAPVNNAFQDRISLTHFDLLALRAPPNQRLFFYETHLPISAFAETVIPKLRDSLSLTLQNFRPLAGTLIWSLHSDEPYIRIKDDDSVPLTIAETDADPQKLFDDPFQQETDLQQLLPPLRVSETEASLLALQITLFPSGDICLGITFHHAAQDGASLALFLKSWAHICRHGDDPPLPQNLIPIFDRDFIDDPKNIKQLFLDHLLTPLTPGGPRNRSVKPMEKPFNDRMHGSFRLTVDDIENLRRRITSLQVQNTSQEPPVRMSTVVVTCAYVLTCFVKAGLTKKHVRFILPADLRKRLQPPVPDNYYGNCVFGCTVDMSSDDLAGQDGLVVAAKTISSVVSELDANDHRTFFENFLLNNTISQEETKVGVGGSIYFSLDEKDFGWGGPKHLKNVPPWPNHIYLAERRDGDKGVDFCLMLAKQEMAEFESKFLDDLKLLEKRSC